MAVLFSEKSLSLIYGIRSPRVHDRKLQEKLLCINYVENVLSRYARASSHRKAPCPPKSIARRRHEPFGDLDYASRYSNPMSSSFVCCKGLFNEILLG